MATFRVTELAYTRLRAPDLEKAESFLVNFGLQIASRTETALYLRGTDAGPYNHIVELGEPAFLGAAFLVDESADLEKAAAVEGASKVESIAEPGGGRRVRLRDPNGFTIEIVQGIKRLEALPVAHNLVNTGAERLRRANKFYRRPRGPALVKRLGHFVIGSPNVDSTLRWYRETLGLLQTDDVYAGSKDHIIAAFSRLARGEEYVDHHVFMVHEAPVASLNHFGFEVQDIDDVLFGHDHLKTLPMEHRWGIGRHVLGSQVFNQWTDPWGRGYEHWTDTDVLTADYQPALIPAAEALVSQWGEPPPARLLKHD